MKKLSHEEFDRRIRAAMQLPTPPVTIQTGQPSILSTLLEQAPETPGNQGEQE